MNQQWWVTGNKWLHSLSTNIDAPGRTSISVWNVKSKSWTIVKSILLYNCSTWISNKTISQSFDAFHRKQLRRCLNIHYPKVIKNEDLYNKTGEVPISDIIKQRRTRYLGHTLRIPYSARDIFYNSYRRSPNSRGNHWNDTCKCNLNKHVGWLSATPGYRKIEIISFQLVNKLAQYNITYVLLTLSEDLMIWVN